MSLSTYGCGCGGCGCDQCRPANTVYRAECTDPGVLDTGTYLSVRDAQFCHGRLASGVGLLQSVLDGSGNQSIYFTEEIYLPGMPDTQGVVGSTFGNLVIIGSDGAITQLLGPAVANQIPITNAAGQLIFGPIPAATVPDPLTVSDLTVTTLAGLANVTISGTVAASGIPAGTIVSFWGLDGSDNVVKQAVTAISPQVAMFFEAPTSPSATTPNAPTVAGTNLTIGNQLYDSGAALLTVTTSQTLTVNVAGKYKIEWCAQINYTGGSSGTPAILLLVNGIIVNNGNGRPNGSTTTQREGAFAGFEARTLAVGDTLQLQLASSSGTNVNVYEARLIAERLSA